MREPSENLVRFPEESTKSALDEILRDGARQMLTEAIETEVASYVTAREDLVDEQGRSHLPVEHLVQFEILDDLLFVPRMVARCDDRHAHLEQLTGDLRRDAETTRGIFPIGDDQVDNMPRHDLVERPPDDATPRLTHHIADK